jgi:hypothetical protein
MDLMRELQIHEEEVRRLRAEHADDRLIRTLIALDLVIRRTATRVLSLTSADSARLPESQ